MVTSKSLLILFQVLFLDDTSHIFDIDKKAKGCNLLDLVFNHLELGEREYFGLVFNDTGGPMPNGHAPDVMRWIDAQKFVRKQVRTAASNKSEKSQHGANVTLYFRVKFYVTGELRLMPTIKYWPLKKFFAQLFPVTNLGKGPVPSVKTSFQSAFQALPPFTILSCDG